MFETLISYLKSGRIKRKQFETLSAAEEHLQRERNKLLERKRNGVPRPASLGDYRMEVLFLEGPPILVVAGPKKIAA